MLSPMRRASIVAVLTTLLLATACGSGGDDQGSDDGDRPADSSTSSGSSTTPTDGEESETSDGASPTDPAETADPTEPAETSAPPAASHDLKRPTVATAKQVPSNMCGLLTAQDLVAADFGRMSGAPQSMPDGGCAAESAGGRFEGLLYGIPPKEPGGKVDTGPMEIRGYDLDGNTAAWGCYMQTETCTALVALGAGRWAMVHVLRTDLAQHRADAVRVARLLLERLFANLPKA